MQIEQLHIDMEDERFILESSFKESLKSLFARSEVSKVEK